ncbi:LysM peptidoglycan-binding domain-containing M23 family metallopeptidase [Flavimaricola marinus]|uniref:Murein hydrolase activator NlpD n=1 Tax=Flavimaricola marinus TaxID=1819565 RepID=A0A238LE51_9RHOB|nr:LysM peptidoglycan-binding domain-containing M23 family metallopeptidase [Flavimaricola marinus]SMY07823.1 Murein hydrolase activator NlpD precursor [Flavimaricola marinus]
MQQIPPFDRPRSRIGKLCLTGAALAILSACTEPFDLDMRDVTNGFDTTAALSTAANRPRPDDRGIISYPNYQVVVAQRDDTVQSIAARLGLDANTLAAYNGIAPDVALRRDEIIALPSRVAEPSPATGSATTGPIQPAPEVSVTTLASDAIDRAEGTAPSSQSGVEPIRHQVTRGETAYSIARVYNVDVNALAEWNGLTGDLAVREGQFLLIPPAGTVGTVAAPVVDTAAPGTGSIAPIPPSAAAPLPEETTPPVASSTPEEEPESVAPDLGSQQSAPAASSAAMVTPAQGSIIREYARGRNDGIDIGAAAGSPVKAAAAGTVAAITTDTAGIQIVVIRHPDNLLTVYTHVTNLTVARDTNVSRGQVIGEVLPGDPSFLHFEVRRGTDSVDPAEFLP